MDNTDYPTKILQCPSKQNPSTCQVSNAQKALVRTRRVLGGGIVLVVIDCLMKIRGLDRLDL